MADNSTLNPGLLGDVIRDIDKSGVKTQVVTIDVGGAGAETLVAGTVPVSGTVSVSGGATSAKQDTGNTSVASIDTKTPALGQALAAASVPVVLTAAQITTLTPVSTVTANAGTNLNTSALALEAGHLATIDTSTAKIPALGQALAAGSVPVVMTASQLTTLTPPAAIVGFALEAGHLATIDTSTAKIPSQGQALAAASMPVVLTAIQQTALTPPAAIVGFALEAGNLATIAAKDFATQTTLATIAAAVKGEDSVAVDADKGIPALAVRQDVPANTTSDAGDYGQLKQDIRGRLWVADDIQEPMVRAEGEVLLAILTELRVMNHFLQTGLNVRDDVDSLRSDAYFNASLQ